MKVLDPERYEDVNKVLKKGYKCYSIDESNTSESVYYTVGKEGDEWSFVFRISDPEDFYEKCIEPEEIAAVLNLNEVTEDYSISTFVRVLSALNIHLEFHQMEGRDNWDLMGKSPSKN